MRITISDHAGQFGGFFHAGRISYTFIMSRIERVIEELTGNEALFEMLETEAADELLNWGMDIAKSVVSEVDSLDDDAADVVMQPRLKALRQVLRSTGNWAAGKYSEPESRIQLRDRLLEQFKLIFGEEATLPKAAQIDHLLELADGRNLTPYQLISKLRAMLEEHSPGVNHAKT